MLFHKPDSADLAALSAWATVLPGASASEDYAHDEMTEYGAFAPDALALCESAEGVAKVLSENADIESDSVSIEEFPRRRYIADTDEGAGLRRRITALTELLELYRAGELPQY